MIQYLLHPSSASDSLTLVGHVGTVRIRMAGLRGGEWQAAGRPRDGAAVRIQGLPLRNSQYGHTVAVTVACSTAIRSTMRSRAHQFSKIQIGDAAAPRPRNCARPSSRSARQHYSLWPQCCSMPALTHSSPLPIQYSTSLAMSSGKPARHRRRGATRRGSYERYDMSCLVLAVYLVLAVCRNGTIFQNDAFCTSIH